MRKRIYMVQANSQYGESIYLPYAAGSLIAYAFKDPQINNQYEFVSFIYKKESIKNIVSSLKNPYLIGFSCYVWNYEFNCSLAKAIKEKYPNCITVFGGHQVNEKSSIVGTNFADYIILGEGEESFYKLLLHLAEKIEFDDVFNTIKNSENGYLINQSENSTIAERESPYLSGLFDNMLEEHNVNFSSILETNRGCPNRCAFCDWGNIKSKIHCFSLDKIFKEIDWMAENKIDYCYCADSNFGLFDRDIDVVDYIIEVHKRTGYPKKFQATYSKNNPETVFMINKKLNDVGLSKGATLSFQSMCENVLNNIFRKNLPLPNFKKLMYLYTKNHIPTYSELIIGLPGESYNSFCDGIEQLLRNGQHTSINFFNCELLTNSIMSNPEYIDRYKIKTTEIEQYQYHIVKREQDIKEYSKIVVETSSLTTNEWIECNIMSVFVRAFHNLGLLQCFSIYLYYEKHISYMDFYKDLIKCCKHGDLKLCNDIYNWLSDIYTNVLNSSASLTCQIDDFGEITWPLDEATYLRVLKDFDNFYEEIILFLNQYSIDIDVFNDLLNYQKAVIKKPWSIDVILNLDYDFYSYFHKIYIGEYQELSEKKTKILIKSENYDDFKTYAYKVVWYGRKGGKNIIEDIMYIDE